MNISLLKKLKRNYKIIEYDSIKNMENELYTIRKGEKIYRLLYKNKKINYAWAGDPKLLLLALCYIFKYNDLSWKFHGIKEIIKIGRERRNEKRKKNNRTKNLQKSKNNMALTEKISEETLDKLRKEFIDKKISVIDYKGEKYVGMCSFLGYNKYCPKWDIQVTLDRTPVTNININSIKLYE